jgi:predicted transposase YdaD
VITSDLQWIARESDVFIRAYHPSCGEFLSLTELQLRYRGDEPVRIHAYSALGRAQFGLSVYSTLVNILPPSTGVTPEDRFDEVCLGQHAHQDFQVLNLWEVDAELAFREHLQPLLPFVPVLRGGGEEQVVRRALREMREGSRLVDFEPLLAFFATFVLDSELVREIMRWDMTVLRESPWYNELIQEGLEKGMRRGIREGMQQGIREGMQQGVRQGEATLLVRQMESRFGPLSAENRERVAGAESDSLLKWGERVLTAKTIEEVFA